ncbi:TPA: hypothetical protein ACGO26_001689 [Streptococcus suis]|jgi:hypothetical protein|uniref:hypothetical protein n=1 Tax=Streptococcus parasuis TaxID=1501662 RepID=UPI0037064695
MNLIIKNFLIALSEYAMDYQCISVQEFTTILTVCTKLTTNKAYRERLDSFIYEIHKIRNHDPTIQQNHLNNVISNLVYRYFTNH